MSNSHYNNSTMTGWTARELARQTNVPASTVAFWVTDGLVTPERKGRGRGGHMIGLAGLMELLAIVELRRAGFSLQAIQRAVENLRAISGHPRPLAHYLLVVRGSDIAWVDGDDLSGMTFSVLQQPGQRLMIFPIGQWHEEISQRLHSRDADAKPSQGCRRATEQEHLSPSPTKSQQHEPATTG